MSQTRTRNIPSLRARLTGQALVESFTTPSYGSRPGRADRFRRSRGQSLVEFALVLPILLLLTLITLDFGRVYLGYINLQSMARIAANFAANNPDAWDVTSPDLAAQTRYKNQIIADAVASNCVLPKVDGVTTVPTPTFIDTNDNGSTDLGDTAKVQISCTFGVITPGIANIVGGSVTVSAASSFPVKSGMFATGAGGPPGSAPSAAFMANDVVVSPSSLSGIAEFVVDFRDTSGGAPIAWAWTFPDDGTTSTARDQLQHTFTTPGRYEVSMTASNAFGSDTATMWVTVELSSTVNFMANPQSGNAPLTVQFTDASTPGGTAYAWTFGTGEGTGSGTTVSHVYSTPGTYTVTLTVTYPDGAMTTSKTAFITVNVAQCLVPSLNGVRRNDAPGIWQGAAPHNFTGTVSDGPGAPKGNYTITTQSLVAKSSVPCNSNVVVNRPNR